MITVKIYANALYVEGHAHFETKGKDIVCAAVSAVIQGFIKSFRDEEIINYEINKAKPSINFELKKNFSNDALNIIETQLKCILNSSKHYLKLDIKKNQRKGFNDEKK